MQTDLIPQNPFAVLTAVVAPAVLTNACSVLCLGTSNRVARVVDRTRHLTVEMGRLRPGDPGYKDRSSQLDRLAIRARYLLWALRIFYAALGSFALTALLAIVGAEFAQANQRRLFQLAAASGLVAGSFAVLALVVASVIMVKETTLALESVRAETDAVRLPETSLSDRI